MPSSAVNERTRQEWRELGFYYESDDESKEWLLVGSRAGLLRFRDILLEYTNEPRNATKSEHDHYGPYMYLKVMTWPESGIDGDSIHGPLDDLRRLASIVEKNLLQAEAGATIRIADEFSEKSEYTLMLAVREDDFDPPSVDPELTSEAG